MGNLALSGGRQTPAEDSPAFGGIAERFRRGGDLERAIALCREGLRKFPNQLSARVTLGWALLDKGDYEGAQVELEQVLRRAPDNLAAIRGLAELHQRAEMTMPSLDSQVQWATPVEATPEALAEIVQVPVAVPANVIRDLAAADLGVPVDAQGKPLALAPPSVPAPVAFETSDEDVSRPVETPLSAFEISAPLPAPELPGELPQDLLQGPLGPTDLDTSHLFLDLPDSADLELANAFAALVGVDHGSAAAGDGPVIGLGLPVAAPASAEPAWGAEPDWLASAEATVAAVSAPETLDARVTSLSSPLKAAGSALDDFDVFVDAAGSSPTPVDLAGEVDLTMVGAELAEEAATVLPDLSDPGAGLGVDAQGAMRLDGHLDKGGAFDIIALDDAAADVAPDLALVQAPAFFAPTAHDFSVNPWPLDQGGRGQSRIYRHAAGRPSTLPALERLLRQVQARRRQLAEGSAV
jgi:hypothetical protein